jgi:hypothetical protein
MTTSTPAPVPLTIMPPSGAEHLGDWELSDDDRIAQRWFHYGEQTTPDGLRVKVHGIQFVDGGIEGLSIAISDDHGDVIVDGEDVSAWPPRSMPQPTRSVNSAAPTEVPPVRVGEQAGLRSHIRTVGRQGPHPTGPALAEVRPVGEADSSRQKD